MAYLESQYSRNPMRSQIARTEPPSEEPTPKNNQNQLQTLKYFSKSKFMKINRDLKAITQNGSGKGPDEKDSQSEEVSISV